MAEEGLGYRGDKWVTGRETKVALLGKLSGQWENAATDEFDSKLFAVGASVEP